MENNLDKNKILESWRSVPHNTLLNFILEGKITISDLENSIATDKDSKSRERIENLKKGLKTKRKEMWEKAQREDSIKTYRDYLKCFGENDEHASEIKAILDDKDTKLWQELIKQPTEEGIKEYQALFPDGLFSKESEEMAKDLPWYQAKGQNTIQTYEQYRKNYPRKHDDEIEKLIATIIDNQDWKTACTNSSSAAYHEYLKKHPDGLHKDEANERIYNRTGRDIFLDELRKDINKYSAKEIQENIANNVATWEDLKGIFDEQQVDAIRDYQPPKQLPIVKDNESLPKGYTEVYFWGTKGTGKTCAIGATIGYLKNVQKSIIPITCPGEKYLHQLENLFQNDGSVCSLPPGTITGNLPAMAFSFKDKKNAYHRTMLIDVAGEVFAGIFKKVHNLTVEKSEEDAINHLKACLLDKYNNKIHYFILEYGNDDMLFIQDYGDVSKSQIMQSLVEYFANENLFNASSVSMNFLVTKCDRIKDGDRIEKVKDYIDSSAWAAVVNGINDVSVNARCGGITVVSFSIGNVFAQDLCIYNPNDAVKIVNEIEERTYPFSNTWLGKIINTIRDF